MTDRELNALPAELASQLRFLDRKVRGLAALRGAGVVCAVLCAGVALGVFADWLLDLGVGIRVAILAGVGVAAVTAAVTAIVRPLVRRTSSAELAALVDTSFPDLRERLESAVELADPDLPEAQKGSPLMRSLLMRETVRTSQGVDFGAAADGSSAFRWMLVGVMALLLLVTPFGLSKDGYALMLSRFLTPWRNLERPTNLYFEVADGDRTVARGDDVTITAVPKWRLSVGQPPEHAWLNWQNASGERDQRRMEWSPSEEAYVATLPHVFTSFEYDVSSDGARTRRFHIDVVERPDMTRLTLEIVPPAYTGHPARSLDGAIGRTEVFERSELTFAVDFNKPIRTAELIWLDEEMTAAVDATQAETDDPAPLPLTLNEEGTAGRLSFEAERGGAYAIVLRDEYELASEPGVDRELVVVFDAPPQVAWSDLDPAQIVNIPPIEARPDDNVPLSVRATDDIGVVDLELHIEVIQRGELLGPLAAESPQLGQPLVSHGFDLALKNYDLRQGDLLSVRTRGVDGRPVPAPQEGWSPARLIRIDKDADPSGLQALMAEQQQLRGAIEQLREDIQQDREQARELESEALQKQQQNVPFERQADVAGLAQSEREIQQRIEQLAAAFGAHPLQQTIAEQTRQIASEPVERARDHFQQAEQAEPQNIGEQRDRLRKAIGDLSEADERLEQLMKKFDELAALERDLQQLQRLAELAERLTEDVQQFEQDRRELERLRKEQALSEQQQQQQQQQLAERQMDLQDEQQDLTSALDHLLEERPEILEAARQQQLEQLQQLADRAGELAEHQERLAEALSREPEQPRPPQSDMPDADRPAAADTDEPPPQQASQTAPQTDRPEAMERPDDQTAAAQPPNQQPSDAPQSASDQTAAQQPDAQQPDGPPSQQPQPNAPQPDAQQMATQQTRPQDSGQTGSDPGPEGSPPVAESPRSERNRPDAPPQETDPSGQPQPMRDQPNESQPAQNAESAPASPAERQRQLAEDAARQAVETARQQGVESEVAEAARQFAEQSLTAAEQARRGLLEDAAESARQAAERAQQTSEQMNRAIEPPPERMMQQSEALAQQQSDVAEQLQQAAQSSPQRQAAQQEGQQQIAQETAQLAEQLAQAAQRMNSQPLNQQEPGQQAQEATQAAQQAQQSQQQANSQMQQQSPREAAEPAHQAAESLRQASASACQACEQAGQPSPSPVPGEVGQQIAEARRELDQAAQQLQQAGPPQLAQQSPQGQQPQQPQQGPEGQPGEGQAEQQPGQQPGEQPGEGQPAGEGQQPGDAEGEQAGQNPQQPGQEQQGQTPGNEGQPGQNGQPGQEGQPSDQASSEAMRRVAESLQQAASQMGLQKSRGSQNQGQNQQSGDAQEGADGPQGGYGARGALSLAELEAELGRISQRNWGQLPHRVESELQLSQQKKPDGDYARLIRMYFEDVARQQPAAEGLNGSSGEEQP